MCSKAFELDHTPPFQEMQPFIQSPYVSDSLQGYYLSNGYEQPIFFPLAPIFVKIKHLPSVYVLLHQAFTS